MSTRRPSHRKMRLSAKVAPDVGRPAMIVKHVFIDTNTLLHYRPLREIDWTVEIQADMAVLVLAPVVRREVSKHKELHPQKRIRKRAADVAKFFHDQLALVDADLEVELKEGVRIRFERRDAMIDFQAHGLRTELHDDYLIASMIEFRTLNPAAKVLLTTGDLDLTVKAREKAFDTLLLKDDYRRAEEPDEALVALQKRVAEYEDHFPQLRLVAQAQGRELLEGSVITLRIPRPVTGEDLRMAAHFRACEQAAQARARRDTLMSDWDSEWLYQGEKERREREHELRLEQMFAEEAREVAQEGREVDITVAVHNDGSAPANNVLVEAIAPGPLEVVGGRTAEVSRVMHSRSETLPPFKVRFPKGFAADGASLTFTAVCAEAPPLKMTVHFKIETMAVEPFRSERPD